MPKTKSKKTKSTKSKTKQKNNSINEVSDDFAEAQLPVDWAKQCYDWLIKSRFTGPIQQTSYKMVKMHLQQSLQDAKGHETLEICIKQFMGFLDLMYERQSEEDTWEKFQQIIYQRYEQGNLMDPGNLQKVVQKLSQQEQAPSQTDQNNCLFIEQAKQEQVVSGFEQIGFKSQQDPLAGGTLLVKDDEVFNVNNLPDGSGVSIYVISSNSQTPQTLQNLLNVLNSGVFEISHKILKKGKEFKVLFKNTLVVGSSGFSLDYWFEVTEDLTKLLSSCGSKKEMVDKLNEFFQNNPQADERKENQEYVELEQLAQDGWKEIE